LLPKAPGSWRSGFVTWSWETMTEEAFTILLRNFGTWYERNSGAGTPTANLSGFFSGTHCSGFGVTIGAAIDDGVPDAERLFAEYFEAISAGVGIEPAFKVEQVRPWLYIAAWPGWGDPGSQDARRIKIKAGYLRRGYTSRQIAAIYQHLSDKDHVSAELILVGYGGQVNAVAPDETAVAQRDSILKAAYLSVWGDAADDDANLERVRSFYRSVYADTGGVPVPNEFNDGSYINYADADLADPALNTSGVPWQTLYYKDHYPRLQAVKKHYDPLNVFRHRLSIEVPA
jgi:berberine-like enzyme